MNPGRYSLLADADSTAPLNEYLVNSISVIQHGWFIGGAICVLLAWRLHAAVTQRRIAHRNKLRAAAVAAQPKSIFTELCERHGLSSDESSLLTEAAQQSALDSPALLFVDPAPLHKLASLQPESAARCGMLIERLFAEPQPEPV